MTDHVAEVNESRRRWAAAEVASEVDLLSAMATNDFIFLFGDTAIVVGVQDQQAAYRGQADKGQLRGTHILVRQAGTGQLAGIHPSWITMPPKLRR
jgi:ketosteroid isomerase-like protein